MESAEFKMRISEVYRLANEIGIAFGIEKCTPDGHLVGAFGQIAAKLAFGLEFGADTDEHNCTWSDGRNRVAVQARCTGAGTIALRREPAHLIALEVLPSGSFTLLYNGPGKPVWQKIQHQKAAQKVISRNVLRELFRSVPSIQQLPIKRDGIF